MSLDKEISGNIKQQRMDLPVYSETNFEEQDLSCSNCHWKGKGYDAVIIDFFGVTKNKEVHCPSCDTTIGIITTVQDNGPGESDGDPGFQTD